MLTCLFNGQSNSELLDDDLDCFKVTCHRGIEATRNDVVNDDVVCVSY